MSFFPSIERILYMLPAFVLAISFHEFAHAWAADRLGDRTARWMGRLTLDPRSHFDLFGFALFVFVGFGWAKGVPYNPNNFKGNRRLSTFFVAIAGVVANFILAILALVLQCIIVFWISTDYIDSPVLTVLEWIFHYNIVFGIFNLLPIPPLDGSKIVATLLPGDFEEMIRSVNPYGMIILLVVVMTGWTSSVLRPLMAQTSDWLYNLIVPIFQGGVF